jgi:hypothetical protein
MADPVLTWAQVVSDNNDPAGVPYPHDIGIYPYGINGFSWELGPDSYLGDPSRIPANGKLPDASAMTSWIIVYQEAVALHGAAKPTVACTISTRKWQSWVHLKTGGWKLMQSIPDMTKLTMSHLNPAQSASVNPPATVTANADGSQSWAGPGVNAINHGWPDARGAFNQGTVDGAFSYFEIKVDKTGANLIAASGIDWWETPSAPWPQNTGYSQSIWKRLTTDWQIITGCSLDPAILQKDPPPPLVGIVGGGTVQPPSTNPPPASGGLSLLAPSMTGDQGQLEGSSYNLWTNGKVGGSLSLPTKGTYRFDVAAHGSVAGGVWPNMNFLLDGVAVGGGVAVNTTTDKTYSFTPPASLAVGAHDVRAQFTNDGTDSSGGDRNLYVTSITAVLLAADTGGGTTTQPPPAPTGVPTVTVTVNGQPLAMKSGDVVAVTIKQP